MRHQLGQGSQSIVLDGRCEENTCQLYDGAFAERAQPKALLALDGVALAAPLGTASIVGRVGRDVDLLGNEVQHIRGRALAGAQRTAGVTQVAKHQRVTEAVVIATAASDGGEVST